MVTRTPSHDPYAQSNLLANDDVAPDGVPDPFSANRMKRYVAEVANERSVAQMRESLPDYLHTRANTRDIDTVLAEYDPKTAMTVLSDAAHLHVFHDTLEALLPGSRPLKDMGDIAHPNRILDRVSQALDVWAARGKPLGGPEYTQ